MSRLIHRNRGSKDETKKHVDILGHHTKVCLFPFYAVHIAPPHPPQSILPLQGITEAPDAL